MATIHDRDNHFCNTMWRYIKARELPPAETAEIVDRRYTICEGDEDADLPIARCQWWNGLGCHNYGCMSNDVVREKFFDIMTDPQQHCPLFGEAKW